MNDYYDEKISNLEDELRVAQELLFLVLDEINAPVVIDAEAAKKKGSSDRRIDLDLDEKAGTWTLKVVTIAE